MGIMNPISFTEYPLQIETSALLLHLGLPLPLERIFALAARSANALVYSSEFERHSYSALVLLSSSHHLKERNLLGPISCRPARMPCIPFISLPSAVTTFFSFPLASRKT